MPVSPLRPASLAAITAAFAMTASPVLAGVRTTHIPQAGGPVAAALPHDVAQDRRWGGGGWGGGWGRGRHHHDGIDGGDVLAGVLVIGAIAAIAASASKSKNDRTRADDSYRYTDSATPPPPSQRYPGDSRAPYDGRDNSDSSRDWGRSQGIDNAVNTCIDEVDRSGSAKVDTVEGVDRAGSGWRVEGRTRSGSQWSCSVDYDGQVRGLALDGKAPYRN